MAKEPRNREGLDQDPFWYKSGVIYEVHVRAFYDSDADGTGDFRGLTEKLDYIKDLGVTAIWLLPFYPSPLKDDGYDIANYQDVHPNYGTLGDFRMFLREAHARGLRVITELVLNHTSDQHPWFQQARRAKPGSRWRNFYVWSDTATEYRDTPIIFKDVEISNWTWDNVAKAHFWHRFFAHQPDLNFDNPDVHQAIFKVVDFWFDLGVDGLRLDAVPYLYEREGTSCENLPETHAFLKKLRRHVDQKYGDRMLLAEANLWPEDAVTYFGQGRGDECHMAFHFPLMPRLFMALRMEDSQPIVDILEQTPPVPENGQWALFLRNHDELTLLMVTDEEREYMYRTYASLSQARLNLGIRRRLAPLMDNDRKSIELLNALLFSLPGTPVLYYGDEIGLGENIFLGDRNGVRTPMQWSPDRNAGFSRANPQSLYLPIITDPGYHYEANNVEVQLANSRSLLWWMRRMLALRKRWRALGEGKCEFLATENRKILSYLLRYRQETLLVVANLSRFTQPVTLDLSAFKQLVPIELFGQTEFPEITDRPYFLSLGPHSFFWFSLEPGFSNAPGKPPVIASARIPKVTVTDQWQEILGEKSRFELKNILPDYLKRQAWFKGKSKTIKLITVRETISVPLTGASGAVITFILVEYVGGDAEVYALPLALASGSDAVRLKEGSARAIAEVAGPSPGILYDAFDSPEFCSALLKVIWQRRRLKGFRGVMEPTPAPAARQMMPATALPAPSAARSEQNNSLVIYGDKLTLKLFRRLEPGVNPELEIGRFLNDKKFPNSPRMVGALEYFGPGVSPITLAVATTLVTPAQNAWNHTLDALALFYERAIGWIAQNRPAPVLPPPARLLDQDIPFDAGDFIGPYLESARLLGIRTAELHETLASDPANKDFFPEQSTSQHRRAVFQSMRNLAVQDLRMLRKQLKVLPADVQPLAQRVLDLEPAIIQSYRVLYERRLSSQSIRVHGDLHLGQILWTGSDFVFIDFEGDSATPISDRRIKRSPLRDVASLVRSFHYAAYTALDEQAERGAVTEGRRPQFEPWLRCWNICVSAVCLRAYFKAISAARILPPNEEDLRLMFRAYLLNHMMGELGRELRSRSTRMKIPLHGLLLVMGEQIPATPAKGEPGASS